MPKTSNAVMISDEIISQQIFFIRNQKVILDRDLAKLYEVETKVLKQAVRRNLERFPPDFMFEIRTITTTEFNRVRHRVTQRLNKENKYFELKICLTTELRRARHNVTQSLF